MAFSIIVTLVSFGIMVILHEAGHFFVAKSFRATVLEFSVGVGPLLGSFKKGGTQYSLRLFPLGGFVRFEDDEGDISDPHGFYNLSPFKRIAILIAGPMVNVLLGFLCFVIITASAGGVWTTEVMRVEEMSPAAEAGIMAGDTLVRLNNTKVDMRGDIELFMFDPPDSIKVTYMRDGKKHTCMLKPSESGKLGVVLGAKEASAADVIKYSYYNTRYVVKAVFFSIRMLVTGGAGIRDLSGPVGIVKVVDETAQEAQASGIGAGYLFITLLNLFAMISVNLGVFNLLPIPALDGGSIIFALLEKVTGKKQNPEILGYINLIGIVLIFGLGIIIMGSDILHIFGR